MPGKFLCRVGGLEYYTLYHLDIDSYEVFLDKTCETYVGICDNIDQCFVFAKYHALERKA